MRPYLVVPSKTGGGSELEVRTGGRTSFPLLYKILPKKKKKENLKSTTKRIKNTLTCLTANWKENGFEILQHLWKKKEVYLLFVLLGAN